MSDRVFLRGMEFEVRIGVSDDERAEEQTLEVDVEMALDLRAAGTSDDLTRTADYGAVFDTCRATAEGRPYRLLEALAEAIATAVLEGQPAVESVRVTVRKPGAPIDGILDHAGVAIERQRPGRAGSTGA